MTTPSEQVAALLVQRDQMLQIIGALIDRTGTTEATLLEHEMSLDRRVSCEPVSAGGALRVRVQGS